MTSPSKNKGNSWEREVATYLTKIYGETFIRAPGSGAYTGGANSSRKQYLHEGQIRNFKGDIVPGQSFPKLNAECKNYGSFPFHQFLQGEIKQLDKWLEQLMTAADPGDFNILICKITRTIKFVAVQVHTNFNFRDVPTVVYNSKDYGPWIICEYDKFWATNSDIVKSLCA